VKGRRPLKRGCGLKPGPTRHGGSEEDGCECGRLGEVDPSNGYEEIAARFIAGRNGRIGPAAVREWSRTLPAGSSILDLGCGHGVPISQTLIEDGFVVYGVDASAKLIAAFRERFPGARTECSSVEDSTFFGRKFDGVIAWGLMFLLPVESQAVVIKKVAGALNRGGTFLFTAPAEAVAWKDSLTGRESVSLGLQEYRRLLSAEGLALAGAGIDEGDNYYFVCKRAQGRQ
jgi:SAM-dependent methyltransferase